MRFLVDAQLPPALARWLESKGYPSLHVADLGIESMPDAEVWEKALELGAVLVSKDEDFFNLALIKTPAPKVVWVRSGNTRKARLLADFESALTQITEALEAGERIVEVRT